MIVHTEEQLMAALRRYEAAWAVMDAEARRATRARYVAEGWKTCGHDSCPPWDCKA